MVNNIDASKTTCKVKTIIFLRFDQLHWPSKRLTNNSHNITSHIIQLTLDKHCKNLRYLWHEQVKWHANHSVINCRTSGGNDNAFF